MKAKTGLASPSGVFLVDCRYFLSWPSTRGFVAYVVCRRIVGSSFRRQAIPWFPDAVMGRQVSQRTRFAEEKNHKEGAWNSYSLRMWMVWKSM